MTLRTTFGLTLLTGLVVGAAWAVLAVPSPTFAANHGECRADEPVLHGDGHWKARRGTLDAQAAVTAQVCEAGELILDMKGVVAGEAGPTVLVSWNSRLLTQREVRTAVRLRLRVPGPGSVTVAFPNDYFRSNDRNLRLDAVRFEASCESGTPRVDPSVGIWNGDHGGLHSQGALTFEACGVGTLTVEATGEAAGGQGPIMAIRHEARTLLKREVNDPETFTVRIPGKGTVAIHFENDYLAPPDDRRLVIDRWAFVPSRSSAP